MNPPSDGSQALAQASAITPPLMTKAARLTSSILSRIAPGAMNSNSPALSGVLANHAEKLMANSSRTLSSDQVSARWRRVQLSSGSQRYGRQRSVSIPCRGSPNSRMLRTTE